MTAIAGIVEDGKVWIGGDSAGVGGSYHLNVRKDPKVFKKGEFIIGFSGSFRVGQLLRFYLTPDTPKEGQDKYEYMVCSFIPAFRQILKDNGCETKWQDGQERGAPFIVGWRGELFRIDWDHQVAQLCEPYCAEGCGQDLVYGSLHSTSQFDVKPKERIIMALEAAEAFSAGVRGPFTVVST